MKLITLILGSIICVSSVAQKEVKTLENKGFLRVESPNKSTSHNEYSFKVDEEKLATKKSDKKTIAYYDEYIKAIETKIEYVKSTPAEDEVAKKSGWYKEMSANLERAKSEREKLLTSGK